MSRLDDLRALRDGLVSRLETCSSDQNYAVLARTLTDILAQIDLLDPPEPVKRKETPLDEFTRKLVERRRAGSKDLGQSSTG